MFFLLPLANNVFNRLCLSVCLSVNRGSVGTTDILQDNSLANLVFHVDVNAQMLGFIILIVKIQVSK